MLEGKLRKIAIKIRYSCLKKTAFQMMDLSQYLGHILVETVKPFFLLLILQIPVGLDSESSYGFDFGY
ncbi:hypothetical protein ACFC54_04675, partial [Enterococcus faecium]|uniref:hypothetical protein n=1 Tax=Enterococcus faecium TaxID=1352 RepID=UPI0035E2ED01